MAITRTQIAKQLLEQGRRVGLRGGGADMGTVSTPGRAARDNREIGARMSRTAASGQGDAMRKNQEAFNTGVDKGYYETFKTEDPKDVNTGFSSILFNSKLGKDFRKFMRRKNIEYFEDQFDGPFTLSNYKQFYSDLRDRFKGKDDGLGDADYLQIPKSGIMVEAPSDMDQKPQIEEVEEPFEISRRFRADGGRIGLRGGDAARSDAASGRNAGRADPSGGVERGGGNRERRISEQYIKPPTVVGGGGEGPKPFLVADATTLPTAGQFGFNLMELKRLKDAGYDPEEVEEGGYSEDLLRALQPITLADGGRAGLAEGGMPYEGGIMDLESARQMYGLGKLVKKVTRSVKKIVKSPIGKAALLYAGVGGLGNLAQGSGLGGMFRGFTSPTSFLGGAKNIFSTKGLKNIAFGASPISMGGNRGVGEGIMTKGTSGLFGFGGELSPLKALSAVSAVSGLLTAEQEEEAQLISDQTGIDIAEIRANPDKYLSRRFRAEGGSTEGKEPVAKKVMPLLDMDGKEKDYRETGGFVDMGRMEKADDVPARLSKNEFVFTADAVRNAGDGSVDKGAEVMYNMMKNLEAGGEVSEESQGLDGARKMFQTSQRLEEVL